MVKPVDLAEGKRLITAIEDRFRAMVDAKDPEALKAQRRLDKWQREFRRSIQLTDEQLHRRMR